MSDQKKEPTAAEAMLFFSIVKNTRNKADVDWDAVATEQGFKNSEVAKVRFGQVKRKLGIYSDPATTPKKAGAAVAPTGSPSKVTKTTGRRAGTKGKGRSKVKKEEEKDVKEATTAGFMKTEEEDTAADHQLQVEMDEFVNPFCLG